VCHRRTQIVDRKGGQHMSDEHVDDFRELEDFWPDMDGLADGVDIFLAQYGPPTGDEDAAYLTAQAGSISSLCNDYATAMALGNGSGAEG